MSRTRKLSIFGALLGDLLLGPLATLYAIILAACAAIDEESQRSNQEEKLKNE